MLIVKSGVSISNSTIVKSRFDSNVLDIQSLRERLLSRSVKAYRWIPKGTMEVNVVYNRLISNEKVFQCRGQEKSQTQSVHC